MRACMTWPYLKTTVSSGDLLKLFMKERAALA